MSSLPDHVPNDIKFNSAKVVLGRDGRMAVIGHKHNCLLTLLAVRSRYRILDSSAVIRFAV